MPAPGPPFVPGERYHLYNHANGFEKLFYEPENYRYFLRKIRAVLEPSVEILAYCLLTNHFHLVVEVRSTEVLKEVLQNWRSQKEGAPFRERVGESPAERYHRFVNRQVTSLLAGYTRALNKRIGRRGSLFQPNTKRKHVHSDRYLRAVLRYVNCNAAHHGIVVDPADYPYSSYLGFLGDADTLCIPHARILEWFGGREAFLAAHAPRTARHFVRDLEPVMTPLITGTRIYEGERFVGLAP